MIHRSALLPATAAIIILAIAWAALPDTTHGQATPTPTPTATQTPEPTPAMQTEEPGHPPITTLPPTSQATSLPITGAGVGTEAGSSAAPFVVAAALAGAAALLLGAAVVRRRRSG